MIAAEKQFALDWVTRNRQALSDLEPDHLALRRAGPARIQIRRLVCGAPAGRRLRGRGGQRRHADRLCRPLSPMAMGL